MKSSQLENKMKLVSIEDKRYLSISIALLVDITDYEVADNSGISHFLEHMLFKGTKTKNYKQLAHKIDNLGGEFNAYTSKEHICIYSTIIPDKLYQAVDIILDIIKNSIFDKVEIEKEKFVILGEIDNNYDNSEEYVFDNLFLAAYKNQYLGRNLLGNKQFIKNITKNHLKKHFDSIFQPQNINIAFVGNIEHEVMKSYIENHKYFFNFNNQINFPKKNNPANFDKVHFYFNNVVYQIRDVMQSYFVLGFQSYKYTDVKVNLIVQILSIILGGGFSSRLFQKFREELALVYSIGTNTISYANSGLFNIYGACNIKDLNLLLNNLYDEISKIMNLITEDEIFRAKTLIQTNTLIAQESSSSLANMLIYDYALLNKFYSLQEIIPIITSINKYEILETANYIFSKKPVYSIISNKMTDIELY